MKSQQLLNINKWVQDKEAKSCKKCQQSFKILIRRKHHCRNCGDVFCDNCSNYFMDKKYFQNLDKIKKNRVRLCQECYYKLQERLRQNNEDQNGNQYVQKSQSITEVEYMQPRRHSKSFNVTNDKLPQSAYQQQKHLDQFITPQKQLSETTEIKYSTAETVPLEDDIIRKQKRYELEMQQKISELIERRTKHYLIHENWNKDMTIFVKQAVQDFKQFDIDSFNEKGKRFLNNFTKIKKIPFVNYTATQYMKGICIRKNVAHKKMQTFMKQASILLISGSLDPDIQTFDSLVKNERKYIQVALECIDILKPNLILIEKSININLLNELARKDITVSIHCKMKQLRLIEQASGASIQKAFDIFNNSFYIDCIGKSDRLIYTNCDPKTIKLNTQLYNNLDINNRQLLDEYLNLQKHRDIDWTYLFISTPQSNRSISITLSGPKIQELKDVKQCFNELCQIAYEISLEYDMIILDQIIKQDFCLQQRIPIDKSPMLTTGELQGFTFSMLNDNEDPNEIRLKKIRYHPAVLSRIHDIQQQNKDDLETYIRENVSNFNNGKISFFCQLCDMQDECINFYQQLQHQKDVKLGKYIIDRAYAFNKCAVCNTKKANHISIRYGPGAFVKCVIGQKQQNKLQIVSNSQQKFIDPESLVDESITLGKNESDDQFLFCQHPEHDLIFTYIQCKVCSKQLTKSFKLEKTHLEFSFYRLIQHMIKSSLRLGKELKTKWLIYPEDLIEKGGDKCNHNQTERVYEKGEIQVKLYTNLFDIYKLQHFKFNCQEVYEHIKQFDVDEIERRREQILMYIRKSELQLNRSIRQTFSTMYKSVSVQSFTGKAFDSEELYNKLQTHPYEDFLELEYDSMQLYSWQQSQNIWMPEYNKRGSLLNPMKSSMDSRSTLITENSRIVSKQKTLMTFNESEEKYQRKNMKHSSQHLKGNIQEVPVQQYPNTQVSPNQIALSPESPGQPLSQIDEQSEMIDLWDNKESINLSKQWPNIAINLDQLGNKEFSSYSFIPLYSIHDIGLIATALNCEKQQEKYRFEILWSKISQQKPQQEYETDVRNIMKDLQSTIKEVPIKLIKNQQLRKKSSTNLQQDEDEINDEETIISQTQQIQASQNIAESPRKQHRTVTVQVYYPKQFECLRILNGINVKQFIKSIASCSSWDSAGGKSGSTFFKSADNLFIFKAVKESEFFTFDEFAPKYFEHMLEILLKKQDDKMQEQTRKSNNFKTKESVLNKIYGMFAIKNTRGTTYFIAMENLFYGMPGELTVYDLKGSEAKRWNKKNLKTLLDTNYIIDRNGEPLPFEENEYNFIKAAIDQDTLFLQSVEVVDYSLLLIIDKEQNKVKMSIIDYLQYYNFNKKIENSFKLAINLGTNPTIVNPQEYRDRFVKAMDRYFMGIRSSL